jgi:DNA primase
MSEVLDFAHQYHRNLPERIRDYMRHERGIADAVIDRHLLGWNGSRITIPIYDRAGKLAFFKLAKDQDDRTDSPKMLATPRAHAELYGWERVLSKPEQIIICEGEFDRLVLESRGFAAVTSTGGALTFRSEWAEALREIPTICVCFDNDDAGRQGAERVARLIPYAKVVQLPEDVGEGGDVTDFFVRLGRNREEFIRLLEAARPMPEEQRTKEPAPVPTHAGAARNDEVEQLKRSIAIEDLVARYVELYTNGGNYRARCPFHDDRNPSFVVYTETQSFYCFGCREHGDVLSFLMRRERLTFPEALKVLRELNGGETGN